MSHPDTSSVAARVFSSAVSPGFASPGFAGLVSASLVSASLVSASPGLRDFRINEGRQRS